jgi:NAD-dependent dihydropyrimidine dehydrogenase PreA subunit
MTEIIEAKQQEKEKVLSVHPDKCTGCQVCQLTCSITYQGNYNPARAYLSVENEYSASRAFSIHFTEKCIPNCNLCAKACPYGALVPK